MTTTQLIRKYGEGKGEAVMWKSVELISQALEEKLSHEEREELERHMYALMQGEHYDEYFAKKQVAHIYYTGQDGMRHEAPYWTDDEIKQVWAAKKQLLRSADVTFWDFYVALNMTWADNCVMYHGWWPEADDAVITEKIIDATINWLNDEDAPQGDARTWRYFNG